MNLQSFNNNNEKKEFAYLNGDHLLGYVSLAATKLT